MGIRDTRVWICPTLCGCEISLNAEWGSEKSDEDGTGRRVSFRHPIPFTVASASVVSVCAAHDALRTASLPPDPHFGCMGYICAGAVCRHLNNLDQPRHTPKADAALSEGERLYVHLFAYRSQVGRFDTCTCRMYQTIDRRDEQAPPLSKRHVRHTHHCQMHQADDEQHTAARADKTRKEEAVATVREVANRTDEDIVWAFEPGTRDVLLTVRGTMTVGQRQSLISALNQRHGGRVKLVDA